MKLSEVCYRFYFFAPLYCNSIENSSTAMVIERWRVLIVSILFVVQSIKAIPIPNGQVGKSFYFVFIV